jgi:Fe-S cluster assembly scaffold protein SufB
MPKVSSEIDLDTYSERAEEHGRIQELRELPEEAREKSVEVGIDVGGACRSGSFFQMDHSVILSRAYQAGLEVMSITEAREKYDGLSEYWWRAVRADADGFTVRVDEKQNHGYFLRAQEGAKVEFPLQACLYMSEDGLAQNVHNVIIAEEGSDVQIITGCATAPKVKTGLHIGVSEFYIKRNARLTFTMVHSWAEDMAVRPRTAAVVEEGGIFISNYVCMKPVRTLQMYPVAYLSGEGSTARYNTVLFAPGGSSMDVGARVYLSARGSRAEVLARAVSGGGEITARGHLVGEVSGVKAHLECRGLILSERGRIHAVPELEGRAGGVNLSHEAAVGKIAEEEVRYLMARGLSSEEATSAIVRGFLDVEIKGLPEHLKGEMQRAVRIGEDAL